MIRRAIAPSLVLAALLGCSSSKSTPSPGNGDGGGDGASSVTADRAAGDVAAASCARLEACAPAYVTLTYGDVATCTATLKTIFAHTLGANGATEAPADLEACASAIPAVSCGDFLSRKPAAACKVKPGTLADGAACAFDSQCQNGRCHVAIDKVCGQCGSPAPSGGMCAVDDDCDDGMQCLGGTCVVYGGQGTTCDATHPCSVDLGCVGGTCGTPGGTGAACTTSAACDLPHGVFCNTVTKLCDPVGYAGPNAMCGLVGSHVAVCTGPGGFCAGVAAPKYQGTCMTPASTGSACDTAAGPWCGAGAICVCVTAEDAGCAGTCQTSDPAACH